MSLNDIHFTRIMEFQGRNGLFKCSGITVIGSEDKITLMPITSKGKQGNCMIDVPIENVNEFINVLKAIRWGSE